jgi:hypothetical protein
MWSPNFPHKRLKQRVLNTFGIDRNPGTCRTSTLREVTAVSRTRHFGLRLRTVEHEWYTIYEPLSHRYWTPQHVSAALTWWPTTIQHFWHLLTKAVTKMELPFYSFSYQTTYFWYIFFYMKSHSPFNTNYDIFLASCSYCLFCIHPDF